jgi:hypothetical protein
MRRRRGTIGLWWSSPVRLLFGETLSLSIPAFFPDKLLALNFETPEKTHGKIA